MLDGTTTFVTGGTMVGGKTTAPDEIRGSSVQGGFTARDSTAASAPLTIADLLQPTTKSRARFVGTHEVLSGPHDISEAAGWRRPVSEEKPRIFSYMRPHATLKPSGTAVAQSRSDMLRISQETAADTTLVRLEGQVTGRWVQELRRVCFERPGENGHGKNQLVIDLIGVSFIDPSGIDLMRELAARHVRFTNGSAFIAEQLKGVADVGM